VDAGKNWQRDGDALHVTEAILSCLMYYSSEARNFECEPAIGLDTWRVRGGGGVSDDAGAKKKQKKKSWSLPQEYLGAPYMWNSCTMPQWISMDNGTYNQIYYNTSLTASQLNAIECLKKNRRIDCGALMMRPRTYQGRLEGYLEDSP